MHLHEVSRSSSPTAQVRELTRRFHTSSIRLHVLFNVSAPITPTTRYHSSKIPIPIYPPPEKSSEVLSTARKTWPAESPDDSTKRGRVRRLDRGCQNIHVRYLTPSIGFGTRFDRRRWHERVSSFLEKKIM